jgi:very-short-patch-repair endonuclease
MIALYFENIKDITNNSDFVSNNVLTEDFNFSSIGNYKNVNTEDFIEKAKFIHGDKYDYSKTEYLLSNKDLIIICKIHGEFIQVPDIHINKKCGCPSCINKTEFLFLKKIQEYYPTLKKQYKVKWCKNKNCLPFDFVIEELKIIIEIDGPQHFIQISNWTSPEIQKEKDKYKINCANENGFSVIRLLQIDILKDKFDWFEELKASISKIIDEQKIQNIFICKNNEYDQFIV